MSATTTVVRRSVVRQPVLRAMSFQSGWCFRLLQAAMVIVTCDGACSLMLPQTWPLKYLVFVLLLGVTFGTFFLTLSVSTRLVYPWGFLTLSLIGALSFVLVHDEGGGITYASALFPMMLVGLSVFLPDERCELDVENLLDFLVRVSSAFVICHVAAQALFVVWKYHDEAWFLMVIHENSFFATFSLCLAILARRKRLAALNAGLIACSLMLRPSSTFAVGLLIGLAITAAMRAGRGRLAVSLSGGIAGVLMLFPVVFLVWPEVVNFIYQIEPFLKQQVLGSVSNNSFRLVVLTLARAAMLKSSWVYGTGFLGTTNVDVGLEIDGWTGSDANLETSSEAPVHCDFMIMLWQGGLIGYVLFTGSLAAMLAAFWRGMRTAAERDIGAALAVLQAGFVLAIVFCVYISFNPTLQKYSFSYMFWFPMLASTLVCRNLKSSRNPNVSVSDE